MTTWWLWLDGLVAVDPMTRMIALRVAEVVVVLLLLVALVIIVGLRQERAEAERTIRERMQASAWRSAQGDLDAHVHRSVKAVNDYRESHVATFRPKRRTS